MSSTEIPTDMRPVHMIEIANDFRWAGNVVTIDEGAYKMIVLSLVHGRLGEIHFRLDKICAAAIRDWLTQATAEVEPQPAPQITH